MTPPIVVEKPVVSNESTIDMPLTPSLTFCQPDRTSFPVGEINPSPVTTTRRLDMV